MPHNSNIGPVTFKIDPPSPILVPGENETKEIKLTATSHTDTKKFDFGWEVMNLNTKSAEPLTVDSGDTSKATWNAKNGIYRVTLTVTPKNQQQPFASAVAFVEVLWELFGHKIEISPSTTKKVGDTVTFTVKQPGSDTIYDYPSVEWSVDARAGEISDPNKNPTDLNTSNALAGTYAVHVEVRDDPNADGINEIGFATATLNLQPRDIASGDIVPVSLQRTGAVPTNDLPLWVVIKKSTDALSFSNYARLMDVVLCGPDPHNFELEKDEVVDKRFTQLRNRRSLPFTDVEAYRMLKAATEAFVMVNCGVDLSDPKLFGPLDVDEVISRVGINLNTERLQSFWTSYLREINGGTNSTLPYLALVREKLKESQLRNSISFEDDFPVQIPEGCFGIIRDKLTHPCLLELIWSYWHEEGMLVQTLNAAALRFQNIRSSTNGRDPLAHLEIGPLRPLNNMFWGYIQDDKNRLSVTRRAYEYNHHYGINLDGKALSNFRPADSRSKFLEAFHNLLHLASIFYKEDDDTTMIADGFPMLNALKEVHLVLSEGAHNQFGDLPSTARIEMLMQQWLLARPEFREFLPTRIMVAFPEAWMDRVEAMKKLQGWSDTSVLHFGNLGKFGEQIVLSIRYGSWSEVNNPAQAANWARFWRSEIQGYVHAYRAATSVDLTSEVTDVRQASQRYLPPSVLLRNRLQVQKRQLQPVG